MNAYFFKKAPLRNTHQTTFQQEAERFGQCLYRFICESETYTSLICLCIGSVRSTGDSLGPLVGYKLEKYQRNGFYIYGTLQRPVHALNLSETIENIKKKHPHALIIAVDASLGEASHIGYVTLHSSPLRPGLGVNKSLPRVGDISITGIVNTNGKYDHLLLQTTSLALVMDIADFITLGVTKCLSLLEWYRPVPKKSY